MAITMMKDMVNPQVMGDMIEAKISALLKVTKYAKVDDSLEGVPGNTITVPSWKYIGDAEDIAEGEEVDLTAMAVGTNEFTIKKAMKAVGITQEAINSGLGNPLGQAERQLAMSIAGKVDQDVFDALMTSTITNGDGAAQISYAGIVGAVGMFSEEEQTEKVLFIAPEQLTTLRLDENFLSADRYNNNVVMSGEIGMIAGVHIVVTKKVVAGEDGVYINPLVKLEAEASETDFTEDELAAVTIFLKKDTQTDVDWIPRTQTYEVTTAKYYGVALTNESKVILVKFASTPTV